MGGTDGGKKFLLRRDSAVLLIVDIQEKLAAIMEERRKVAANCVHLVEAAKLLSIPVVLTEQYSKGLGPTIPEIKTALHSYEPIEKMTFDCCGEPSFLAAEALGKGEKTVVLAGMETHICVLQTCLGLLDRGFKVHVISDAVCSRAKENYFTALEFMRDAGAVVSCTETALFQLLERVGTQEFRAVSRRIK
ncbi:MAG: hydrolase [Nitrospiraceae bacterium]|nr:hydrolase [Nitrospiraceae bacterium]